MKIRHQHCEQVIEHNFCSIVWPEEEIPRAVAWLNWLTCWRSSFILLDGSRVALPWLIKTDRAELDPRTVEKIIWPPKGGLP